MCFFRKGGSIRIGEYICRFKRRKGYDCRAKLRIIRPHDSNLIIASQWEEHSHEPMIEIEGQMKLTEEVKEIIAVQLKEGKTAQQIRLHFQDVCLILHLKI